MSRRRCLFSTKLQAISGGTSYDGEITIPSYDASGGSCTITIFSNKNWIVDQTNSSEWSGWITLSCTGGTNGMTNLTITTSQNNTESAKSVTITLKTKNDRKSLDININQNIQMIDLYFYHTLDLSDYSQPVYLDYNVGGETGHTTVATYPGTFIGAFPSGTEYSYTASTYGYYDTIRTNRTLYYTGSSVDHVLISFTADTEEDFLDVVAVFYSGTTSDPVYEDRWMPEETFFNSAGTPQRVAFIEYGYHDGTLLDNWWFEREPKALIITNLPSTDDIKINGTYISGGTDWMPFVSSGDPIGAGHEFTYFGVLGSYSAYTYNIHPWAGIADRSGDTLFAAVINFCNGRNNNALLATLPVVTQTTQENYIKLYPHGSNTPVTDYHVTIPAGSGYTGVDIEACRITRWRDTEDQDYNYSALSFYNEDKSEEISFIYPTVLSGKNGTMTFMGNGRYNLNILHPANHSLSDSVSYGASIGSNDGKDEVERNVYITKSPVTTYDTDYFISGVSVVCNYTGQGLSAITIPSSSITYNRGETKNMQVWVNVCCRHYSTDGSVNVTGYPYTDYIVVSGGGYAVNQSKLQIEMPNWMTLANSTGSANYDYTPTAAIPYAINVTANQSSGSTGSSRTGNITVKWVGGDLKPDGPSARTVSVTQVWDKLPANYGAWIYSVSGTPQPVGTSEVSLNITRSQTIYLQFSATSGTQIIVGEYAGGSGLRDRVGITIGNRVLTQSNISYTASASGTFEVQITDKNYNNEPYSYPIAFTILPPPSQGYENSTITITVSRTS